MSDVAAPPGTALTEQKTLRTTMKKNGESWGFYLAKWALGMLAVLITSAILYGAAASIETRVTVRTIETKQEAVMHNQNRFEDVQIRLEDKMDAHIQQTATQAHRGGG